MFSKKVGITGEKIFVSYFKNANLAAKLRVVREGWEIKIKHVSGFLNRVPEVPSGLGV
jgi:hypothetical protein